MIRPSWSSSCVWLGITKLIIGYTRMGLHAYYGDGFTFLYVHDVRTSLEACVQYVTEKYEWSDYPEALLHNSTYLRTWWTNLLSSDAVLFLHRSVTILRHYNHSALTWNQEKVASRLQSTLYLIKETNSVVFRPQANYTDWANATN
jgi:hypothetical protein